MKGVGCVLLSDYHLYRHDTDRTNTQRKGKETEADFQSVLEAEQKKMNPPTKA